MKTTPIIKRTPRIRRRRKMAKKMMKISKIKKTPTLRMLCSIFFYSILKYYFRKVFLKNCAVQNSDKFQQATH